MILHYTLGLFFLVSRIGCGLGVNCFYYGKSSIYLDDMYCAYGCCGNYYNQYCCVNVGGIVGGVIGFLIFVGIIIMTISCLFCACCQPIRKRFDCTVFRTILNRVMRATANEQGDEPAGYPTGLDTYQEEQTSPPNME